ncbi:hypothetical protein AX760_18195 [Pararhizobium antarcticum]|uniref:Uncharacterized protein n=1 Tax=Pararhizobium antarcticum TaxID=1798805 RepID=A0A657LST5_9HYPH|nr:hypothetical protein AX760_18195 [Pararhizobium antarcticum]
MDARLCGRRRQKAQLFNIPVIHAEDQVESFEIRLFDAPAALLADVDAVTLGHGDGARIGCIAEMPAAGSR